MRYQVYIYKKTIVLIIVIDNDHNRKWLEYRTNKRYIATNRNNKGKRHVINKLKLKGAFMAKKYTYG